MQPNQNQYDFIMQPPNQRRKGAPLNKKMQVLIMSTLIVVVLIVVIIGFSFVSSIGKANNDDLIEAIAWQTELERIVDEGIKNTPSQPTRNRLITMQVTINSDKKALNELLSSRNVKLPKERLASKKDRNIDADLEVALRDGSYETTLEAAVLKVSQKYYDALLAAAQDTASNAERELLNQAIENVELTAKTQE